MLYFPGCTCIRPVVARGGARTLTTRRVHFIAALTVLAVIISAVPAFAVPVSSKRDQAIKVKAQIKALDDRVEVASEQYNEAADKHEDLLGKAAATKKELKAIRGRMGDLQGSLNSRAVGMYRSGPLSFIEVLLGASDFEEFTATWDLLTDVNRKDAEIVAELKTARAAAKVKQAELETAEASAKKERDKMAGRKKAIESQLAERKGMLAGLESEIAEIERSERERAAAAALALQAARRTSYASRGSSGGGNPSRAAKSEVVDIAMRYLGSPYRWAASGPNSFDCSGFTMYVYAQVGVSLPHSSRAQYGSGERVSRSNLQPGDLVFFGSPIHHVGIYVGGGNMIHAPRTGDVVKIAPLHSNYVGACRP